MKEFTIKIIKIGIAALFALIALLALVYGVWRWASGISPDILAAYGIIITLSVPTAALVSYWIGKTEARGLISGIDTGVSKVSDAVGLRDASQMRVNHWREPVQRAQNITVQLPNVNQLPSIIHRQPDNSEILDL